MTQPSVARVMRAPDASPAAAEPARETAVRGGEPLGEWRQTAGVLKRIAGSDEPPHPIEPDPPHRQQAGGAMGSVRRIEGAAEQPNAHAARVRG